VQEIRAYPSGFRRIFQVDKQKNKKEINIYLHDNDIYFRCFNNNADSCFQHYVYNIHAYSYINSTICLEVLEFRKMFTLFKS
jgi:hypothetical protein